jgi:hypothetical protein
LGFFLGLYLLFKGGALLFAAGAAAHDGHII